MPETPVTPTTTPNATNDLWEAMSTQRAIRYYKPDSVPADLIQKTIEAATRAPSGSNLQPWAFVVVQDDAVRAKIAERVRERFLTSDELQKYLEDGRTSDDSTRRKMMSGVTTIVEQLDSAPVFILPCLYTADAPPAQGVLGGSSIYPAVQNLLLSARSLGLGTVMTTFQAAMLPDLREWLKLPENALPVALILMGYPATKFGPVKRKPAESVTHWGTWEGKRS